MNKVPQYAKIKPMFAPFNEDKAFEVCTYMKSQLECGALELKTLGKESQERSGLGLMLGALVCKTQEGSEVNLVCCSGVSKQLQWAQEDLTPPPSSSTPLIFVPPVASPEKINAALEQNDLEIHQLTEKINSLKALGNSDNSDDSDNSEDSDNPDNSNKKDQQTQVAELKQKRIELCNQSLEKVYDLYSFHCANGTVKSLKEICRVTNKGKLPPTGTGECCAPKLLDYAYANNLVPESMCEIYYGKSSESKNKINGNKYSPCNERCGLILPEMLGLKILYRDSHIIVVDKQSGVLSVPGRGPEKQDCIVNRVRRLFPECITQPSVHRLDMETSGLLVLAFTEDAHRKLCRQFEDGLVKKHYVALIDGVLAAKGIPEHGQNELYFRLDIDNRPHQIWDEVYGKKAITEWNVLGVEKYTAPDGSVRNATRVQFLPHTGRTHQLRLASSDSHGFGLPIIGDTLYGHCEPGERLMLHAEYLSFTHPVTEEKMEFNCPSPF